MSVSTADGIRTRTRANGIRTRVRGAATVPIRHRMRLRLLELGGGALPPADPPTNGSNGHDLNGGGRPTKFTSDNCATILQKIEEGTPLTHAPNCAGVSYDAFNVWCNRGKRDAISLDPATRQSAFADFYKAVKKAESGAVHKMAKTVMDAAPANWQAAAWYLERRDPANFARKDRLEHSGRIDSLGLQINVDQMREDIPDSSLVGIMRKVLTRSPALALTNGEESADGGPGPIVNI